MPEAPRRVVWTDHALVKARTLGLARTDVEVRVLDGHGSRERNAGSGDWRILVGRVVVVYNHPDREDSLSARVVTVWRRR